jgi:hypothetical protein
LATIDRFSDMLNTVLSKNDAAAVPRINPKSVSIWRYSLKSYNSLRNSTGLIDRVQANT